MCSLGYWKRLQWSKRLHSQNSIFKMGFLSLVDNWCQSVIRRQVPSRTQRLSEPWWQGPFNSALLLSILKILFCCCVISKLLININRPCQKGAIPELSEELPVHINQLLIYNSYVLLLLKVFRGGRARKNLESSQTWYQSNRQFHPNNDPDPQHHQ